MVMKGLIGAGSQLMRARVTPHSVHQQKRRMASVVSVETIRNWTPTAMLFGVTGFIGMVYFTDWRVITDWIPFYNGKYEKVKDEEEE